jgi:hypothetical protein
MGGKDNYFEERETCLSVIEEEKKKKKTAKNKSS